MRYLVIAAAALAATTTFASADTTPVKAGPVQLSAAQLDDVTAGNRRWSRLSQFNASASNQSNTLQNNQFVYQSSGGANCTLTVACISIAPNINVSPQTNLNLPIGSQNRIPILSNNR